jgi:hypothetical protein
MSIINYLLSCIPPNIVAAFVIFFLCYVTYYVYSYRKLILATALVSAIGYIVFLVYSKEKLVQKIEQSQVYDGFSKTSLGYSLNNPGNIRVTGTMLPGEVRSDAPFKKFTSMKYGFRAMTGLLHNYIDGGYNTIDKIVNRYAPASDNNTPDSYAREVAKNSNVKLNQVLTEADFRNGNMLNIMYFMTRVEQGYAPNIKDLSDGFDMYYSNL